MVAESLESERFAIDATSGSIIFSETMTVVNYGKALFDDSIPVSNTDDLCGVCRNDFNQVGYKANRTRVVTAFAPDRSPSSYTYGWPEILFSMVGGLATLATFHGAAASRVKLAFVIAMSLFHAAGHAWAAHQFYRDVKTAPWVQGESWLLLFASWSRIWLSTVPGPEDIRKEKGGRVAGRWSLRSLCVFGMLLCFATGIGVLAINLTAYIHPDLHAWRHAYSLLDVPTQCMGNNIEPPVYGQVPAVLHLPAPYHTTAQRFLLIETISAWLALPLILTMVWYSVRGRRMGFVHPKIRWLTITLVVLYLVLKVVELAFAARSAAHNYVVPWSRDCCLVMPSQKFGNLVDSYGIYIGVFGRLFAMI